MLTDNEVLEVAQAAADKAWQKMRSIWGAKLGTMPKIILNNRLKATAGRCDFTNRVIDLSPSLMRENVAEFENVTIPHELAHQVAWDVYKDPGHGADWKSVMVRYGLPAERCHSMTSSTLERTREVRQDRLIRRIASEIVLGDTVTFVHRNRQRVETDIVGKVIKVNLKTFKIQEFKTGLVWTVPKENTCNLRHA